MGVGTSFSERFDRFAFWRKSLSVQIASFREWLTAQNLMETGVQAQLLRLEALLQDGKISVAFVAEFSRGKSELINAVLFASNKRRIMPATPGRTTMCPTELSYDPSLPSSLRLLPVTTRGRSESLSEWRTRHSAWYEVPLDVNNPEQLAQAMAHVVQVKKVSVNEAKRLGFWSDDDDAHNELQIEHDLIEIPKWRHAIVNIPHPLLQQGLVVMDTPGFNAVGTEPELTVNLIAQAHAVVFLLSADAGATKSDLNIWNEHLLPCHRRGNAHLVVLNKIDTLWGNLDTQEEIQAQINHQCLQSAKVLGVDPTRVIPVSAQKGLAAKIQNDTELLERSGIASFEVVLAESILQQRQNILRNAVEVVLDELQAQVLRTVNVRQSSLDEQMLDLRSLRGKNTTVTEGMRSRIEQEKKTFEITTNKILAVRNEHLQLMKTAFQLLGTASLKSALQDLSTALLQPGLKLGVRKVYTATFERLRRLRRKVVACVTEFQGLLTTTFTDLNTEFGFALQYPRAFNLADFEAELYQIEDTYRHYLGVAGAIKLANPVFCQQLLKALALRLRTVFESAASELDLWNKSATSQLDAQLSERKRSFTRRIEAVDRINEAASGLMGRIAEIEAAEQQLKGLQEQLQEWISTLYSLSSADVSAVSSVHSTQRM